ncbi:Fluoroacetate dehalogenase [Cyphellophora attinorum]|uniref:Fluoroacetate dehalogenase n=1 Tax=Cyphellophora attinorum TaxID=1664694 RepID=A0A0N0NMJ6_9EURO|nr:Fluoroacetate dehalogenase [Phialophora attinorum]KPI40279.1 Fluoroacetate dehalogenase [Phialophora attinorum]
MAAVTTQKLFSSHQLTHNVTKLSPGQQVHSYSSDLGPDSPVLTLIHGYPQWRYLAPLLKSKISLFIPELPGYGISHPQQSNDKRSIGTSLLQALTSIFGPDRRVILGGHDRGARICHRLAVDAASGSGLPNITVLGVVMLDIRIAGPSAVGKERVAADGALDVYGELFDSEEVIRYTAEDYRAGAQEDVDLQKEDQKAGRKIAVPTLVMFSKARLGMTLDVEDSWRSWVADGVDYKGVGVGDERGHYLPEEAHEDVYEEVVKFIEKVATKKD